MIIMIIYLFGIPVIVVARKKHLMTVSIGCYFINITMMTAVIEVVVSRDEVKVVRNAA